jgi:hypothetical protein
MKIFITIFGAFLALFGVSCSAITGGTRLSVLGPSDIQQVDESNEGHTFQVTGYLNGRCLWTSQATFETFRKELDKEDAEIDWDLVGQLERQKLTIVINPKDKDAIARANLQNVILSGAFISNSTEETLFEVEKSCTKRGLVLSRIIGSELVSK